MNIWPIIFIILAVAMVVGPIMMFQPSKRDKYLANLRQKAAIQGLEVRMADYSIDNKSKPVAVYSLMHKNESLETGFLLLRASFEHGIHYHKTWECQKGDVPTAVNSELPAFLDSLPDTFLGVEATSSHIGLWWLEPYEQTEYDVLLNGLERLKTILDK